MSSCCDVSSIRKPDLIHLASTYLGGNVITHYSSLTVSDGCVISFTFETTQRTISFLNLFMIIFPAPFSNIAFTSECEFNIRLLLYNKFTVFTPVNILCSICALTEMFYSKVVCTLLVVFILLCSVNQKYINKVHSYNDVPVKLVCQSMDIVNAAHYYIGPAPEI